MLQPTIEHLQAAIGTPIGDAVDPDVAINAIDDVDVFATQLLTELVLMASRSKRRQADLTAVLRRARLPNHPEQVGAALALLRDAGLIQDIVPLYDGGVLISITSQGMDRPRRSDQWAFLERRTPFHI